MKRALISVSDKTGIIDFAKELIGLGFTIISTGGTYKTLAQAGLIVTEIESVTGFPECLDGRLKTLHPKIHGGLLGIRDNKEHLTQMETLGLDTIDIAAVNLYPFKSTILKEGVTLAEAIENIDIGGPTMLRSAAKNYRFVSSICDAADYDSVVRELKEKGAVSKETNLRLAAKVFMHTAAYDALIASYLKPAADIEIFPPTYTLTYEKALDLRYGENPHQNAAFYREIGNLKGLLPSVEQLHGKELSFNNINDANGALLLLKEYDEPTVVACKHANPCGAGSAAAIYDAYMKAYTADPVSIFGGIITANREIDAQTAAEINKIFVEIIIAPSYSDEALLILKQKKNIRVLKLQGITAKQSNSDIDIKKVSGGILIQDIDNTLLPDGGFKCVTEKSPAQTEINDMLFAWRIVKYVKSNGIAIARNKQSLGIGCGQMNRIWAVKQAIDHCIEAQGAEILKGAVLASDAFFPFADCAEAAHEAGITAIIQPGGSVKDKESIDVCNKYGMAMVFTDMRHFRH